MTSCRDIVVRRKEAQAKLKKLTKVVPCSPGMMQDMLAIVSTVCQVCTDKGDDGTMLLCDGCDHGYHTYCTIDGHTQLHFLVNLCWHSSDNVHIFQKL